MQVSCHIPRWRLRKMDDAAGEEERGFHAEGAETEERSLAGVTWEPRPRCPTVSAQMAGSSPGPCRGSYSTVTDFARFRG